MIGVEDNAKPAASNPLDIHRFQDGIQVGRKGIGTRIVGANATDPCPFETTLTIPFDNFPPKSVRYDPTLGAEQFKTIVFGRVVTGRYLNPTSRPIILDKHPHSGGCGNLGVEHGAAGSK
jgi:hypothetical protein